jgi:hypothetical protein
VGSCEWPCFLYPRLRMRPNLNGYVEAALTPVFLRYMPISIEGSIEVAANQQRRSLPPLPSASPHQNPRLLPRLASCIASITHYPFHLHLDFKRANVNNNKCAALQQRVTQVRYLLLRYVAKFSAYTLSPSAVYLLHLLLL